MNRAVASNITPTNAWNCQFCGASCVPGVARCAACGFPAAASAADLERARQLGSVAAFLDEQRSSWAFWRDASVGYRIRIVLFFLVFFAGAGLARIAGSLRLIAPGAVLMLASVLVLWRKR